MKQLELPNLICPEGTDKERVLEDTLMLFALSNQVSKRCGCCFEYLDVMHDYMEKNHLSLYQMFENLNRVKQYTVKSYINKLIDYD